MKENKNMLKRVTDKVDKNNKKQANNSKKQRCESKANKMIEDDGFNCEDELKKSKESDMKFRKDYELACDDYVH